MSLILASVALGLVPAFRGSLIGVLLSAWILAGIMSAAILFGTVDLANVVPAIGSAILSLNLGVAMGFGLNHALAMRPVKS